MKGLVKTISLVPGKVENQLPVIHCCCELNIKGVVGGALLKIPSIFTTPTLHFKVTITVIKV